MRFLAISRSAKTSDRVRCSDVVGSVTPFLRSDRSFVLQAILSADKNLLIVEASRQNKQVFDVPPTLEEFTRLFRVIAEETVTFNIWPICSLKLRMGFCLILLPLGKLLVFLLPHSAAP